MRPITYLLTGVSALTAMAALPAVGQDAPIVHGRVSFSVDSGLIKGTEDDDWSYANVNTLVLPGDALWVDEEGTLEAEFNGGTFLRLVDGSKAEIFATPPQARFKGWEGSFYIHRVRQSTGEVIFETPVGDLSIENDSQVRVDILDEGSTTITVRWGTAVYYPQGGAAIRIHQGKRIYVDPGYTPSQPEDFDKNYEDAFDSWNRERSRSIAIGSQNNPIGAKGIQSAPIGSADLNGYGEWVTVDNRRSWKPTVADYVPYQRGSWSYVPSQGYVWVGYYPFSYITSHHGYWDHHNRHGWIWSYNPVYSPAYVASVRYGDMHVWAPLGIHGDAVYHGNNYTTIGGFRFGFGTASYVYANQIYHGNSYVHGFYRHHVNYGYNTHAYRWNLYNHKSPHYTHRPRYKTHYRSRDYSPSRVMRGSDRHANGYDHARTRVSHLESRSPHSSNRGSRIARDHSTRTISSARSRNERHASVRSVRINTRNSSVQHGGSRDRTTRTYSNRDAQRHSGTINRIRTIPKTSSHNRIANPGDHRVTRSVPNSTRNTGRDKHNSSGNNIQTRTHTVDKKQHSTTQGRISTRQHTTTPRITTRQNTSRIKTQHKTTTRPNTVSPRISTRQHSSPSGGVTPRVSTQHKTSKPHVTSPRISTRQSAPRISTRQSSPRISTRQSAPAPRVSSPRKTTRHKVSAPRVNTRSYSAPPSRSSGSSHRSSPSISSRSSSSSHGGGSSHGGRGGSSRSSGGRGH